MDGNHDKTDSGRKPSTSAFDRLDEFLTNYDSPAEWSDDAESAGEYARALPDDDWLRLAEQWPSRPENWQAYAADAISSSPNEHSLSILSAMILTGPVQTQLAAANVLALVLQRHRPTKPLDPQLLSKVEDLAGNATGLLAKHLHRVADQIKRVRES